MNKPFEIVRKSKPRGKSFFEGLPEQEPVAGSYSEEETKKTKGRARAKGKKATPVQERQAEELKEDEPKMLSDSALKKCTCCHKCKGTKKLAKKKMASRIEALCNAIGV